MQLVNALLALYRAKGYRLAESPGEVNICYIEGANEDGSPRENTPNEFNDRRLVLCFYGGQVVLLHNALATTEPGRYYTDHPMDARGAARIALGQHLAAWRVGVHQPSKPSGHPALVQCAPIRIHRDLNRDFSRAGDAVTEELIGLDQHRAYGEAQDDIGRASAGCLVGWNRAGHEKFMAIVETDPRFKADPQFAFDTAIIAATELQPYLSVQTT